MNLGTRLVFVLLIVIIDIETVMCLFVFGDRYKVESIPLEWVRTLSVLNLLSTHTKAVYQRVMSNTTPVIV